VTKGYKYLKECVRKEIFPRFSPEWGDTENNRFKTTI
jgi:hypothetical protein